MTTMSIADLATYWAVSAFAWGALTWGAWRLMREPRNHKSTYQPQSAALIILLSSLVIRALFVGFAAPRLSDDIYRYWLDGRTLSNGQNPYQYPPAYAQEKTSFAESPVFSINHPELVTVYQPTSQWTFAVFATLDQAWLASPYRGSRTLVTCFLAGFSLFDLWLIALILLKLIREKRSPWWAALYAFHPLAITEFPPPGIRMSSASPGWS